MSKADIRWNYLTGKPVNTLSLVRAGILVETEATKMLTAQYNDPQLTREERVACRQRIDRAGYVVASYGNMKGRKVFEEVL